MGQLLWYCQMRATLTTARAPVHRNLAQVAVAALTDPGELCVGRGPILARYNSEPSCRLSSLAEVCPLLIHASIAATTNSPMPGRCGLQLRLYEGLHYC